MPLKNKFEVASIRFNQMRISNLLGWSGIAVVVLAASSVSGSLALAQEPISNTTPIQNTVELGPKANLKSKFSETSVDEIFQAVATRIRFEPYAGVLRGAEGTAIAGSGNSLDQSMLLARLLRRQGYSVRFVAGSLEEKNRRILLRGLFPPNIPELSFTPEYAPFDPYSDSSLLKLVKDHYWLEVRQGDSWLPLDPSFPRAVIGEAYGVAKERMDQVPEDAYATIKIVYKRQLVSSKVETAAELDERVADIAMRPISLVGVMVPLQMPVEESNKSKTMGTFGGALSGKNSTTEETEIATDDQQIVGAAYEWRLVVPRRGMMSGVSVVLNETRKTGISREWLEFEIRTPGGAPQKVTRTLFQASSGGKSAKPPEFSHYTVSLFNGPVSQHTVRQQIDIANKGLSLTSLKRSIDAMHASAETSGFTDALAIEQKLGTKLLHLLSLRMAAESDSLSDMGAYRNGVALSRATPRIYISSLVSGESGYSIAMDLRLDEVTAIPFPGAPLRLAELFQRGRGFQNSVLEGKILEHFTGEPAITTARLMSDAREQDAELFGVDAKSFGQFAEQTKLPKDVGDLVRSYLKNGGEVVIAGQPIEMDGRKRWGWWALDPGSGRAIGVMDDGRHQAMIEYTVDTKEIGLNPKTGMVVGGIVGATSALFVISAKILEYGVVTDAMIDDVENFLKGVSGASCPGASSSIGAGVSFGGDCLKKGVEAGVGAGVSFCAKYADGFNCTAGLILGALKGESPALEFN